ncbi:zinc ribbon domain-containing protein [Metapseudomonas otitidis]|uniref:zinc ribbon domain-containing protein n=1 Tax=Metapseudomonas otitidis TaxID=319939 RepID=UPI0013E020B3|nr:zinc ribbon domain-containing protein [Pseudomonas otitidis]
MALKPCRSCKHQIDSSAKTCPNCGVANPGISSKQQFIGFVGMVIVMVVMVKTCSGGDGQKDAATPKVDPATCRKELSCWAEEKIVTASVECKRPVESLAKYNARWTDGVLDMKFSHYRWKDQAKGTVTYIGDKIEFQNGFGAYQKHIYECDFDPSTVTVLDVRARPGQL